MIIETHPAVTRAQEPLFADFVARLEDLYAGYTIAELATILRHLKEVTRQQQLATDRLTGAAQDGRREWNS